MYRRWLPRRYKGEQQRSEIPSNYMPNVEVWAYMNPPPRMTLWYAALSNHLLRPITNQSKHSNHKTNKEFGLSILYQKASRNTENSYEIPLSTINIKISLELNRHLSIKSRAISGLIICGFGQRQVNHGCYCANTEGADKNIYKISYLSEWGFDSEIQIRNFLV